VSLANRSGEDASFVLSDALGNLLRRGLVPAATRLILDIGDFPAGMYFLRSESEKSGVAIQKLVISR
jgi:hypothetical protein